MSAQTNNLQHEHVFLGEAHARNTRRIWLVIALTASMMVAEIAAGTWYGSMALVADGWHMSTHASAMLISAVSPSFPPPPPHQPPSLLLPRQLRPPSRLPHPLHPAPAPPSVGL